MRSGLIHLTKERCVTKKSKKDFHFQTKEKEIRIDGLTTYQVDLLNQMWDIKTSKGLEKWIRSLSDEDQNMVLALRRIIICEMIDQETIAQSDCSMAQKILDKFLL